MCGSQLPLLGIRKKALALLIDNANSVQGCLRELDTGRLRPALTSFLRSTAYAMATHLVAT